MSGIVKVLIILCVVGVVIGLALPAVCKVRESAKRIGCKNNLKQIGLSVSNYADTTGGQLPQATFPNDRLKPEQRLSWLFTILPFVESDNIYSRTKKELSWDSPENHEYVLVPYKPFLCPSERNSNDKLPIKTDYVGLAGIGPEAGYLPKDSPFAGVFGYERKIKMEDIKDGTSNTILAIDTTIELGPWAEGGRSTVRDVNLEQQPYIGAGRQFGGMHPPGEKTWFGTKSTVAIIAFADGSTRTLNDTIDPRVFEALVTIAGGEEVPGDY